MKKLFLIISALFAFYQLQAQDIIIRNSGDTVRCKITSLDSFNIYLSFKKGQYTYNTFISKHDVKEFHYKAYVDAPKIENATNWKFPKLRLNIASGAGYLLSNDPVPPIVGDITSADKKTFDNLRMGLGFGADLDFYFLRFMGIGVKYSYFKSSTNLDSSRIERYTYNYIGPSISFIGIMINKAAIAHFSITGGKFYLNHFINQNEETTDGVTLAKNDYTIKANTYGFGATVGFDFLLDSEVALGIESSLLYGKFKKFRLEAPQTTTEDAISLDVPGVNYNTLKIDVSIGLKFYL
jgi:hypothetical protein